MRPLLSYLPIQGEKKQILLSVRFIMSNFAASSILWPGSSTAKWSSVTAGWPNGKALDYESRDCRFDPCVGHFFDAFPHKPLWNSGGWHRPTQNFINFVHKKTIGSHIHTTTQLEALL